MQLRAPLPFGGRQFVLDLSAISRNVRDLSDRRLLAARTFRDLRAARHESLATRKEGRQQRPWTGARISFGRVARKHDRNPIELAAADEVGRPCVHPRFPSRACRAFRRVLGRGTRWTQHVFRVLATRPPLSGSTAATECMTRWIAAPSLASTKLWLTSDWPTILRYDKCCLTTSLGRSRQPWPGNTRVAFHAPLSGVAA